MRLATELLLQVQIRCLTRNYLRCKPIDAQNPALLLPQVKEASVSYQVPRNGQKGCYNIGPVTSRCRETKESVPPQVILLHIMNPRSRKKCNLESLRCHSSRKVRRMWWKSRWKKVASSVTRLGDFLHFGHQSL